MTEVTTAAVATTLVSILGWVIRSGMTQLRAAMADNTEAIRNLLTTLALQEQRLAMKIEQSQHDHRRHEEETREVLKVIQAGNACRIDSVLADKMSRAANKTLKSQKDQSNG